MTQPADSIPKDHVVNIFTKFPLVDWLAMPTDPDLIYSKLGPMKPSDAQKLAVIASIVQKNHKHKEPRYEIRYLCCRLRRR